MHELKDTAHRLIAGGDGDSGFGYGPVPGFFDNPPKGPNYTHSFDNGWSLSFGSTLDGSAKGIGVSYVW